MTLLTEAQAKTKWCPLVRTLEWTSDVVRGGGEPVMISGSVNRAHMFEDGRHACVGSACMAWRWLYDAGDKRPGDGIGYCGAFGRPE